MVLWAGTMGNGVTCRELWEMVLICPWYEWWNLDVLIVQKPNKCHMRSMSI